MQLGQCVVRSIHNATGLEHNVSLKHLTPDTSQPVLPLPRILVPGFSSQNFALENSREIDESFS